MERCREMERERENRTNERAKQANYTADTGVYRARTVYPAKKRRRRWSILWNDIVYVRSAGRPRRVGEGRASRVRYAISAVLFYYYYYFTLIYIYIGTCLFFFPFTTTLSRRRCVWRHLRTKIRISPTFPWGCVCVCPLGFQLDYVINVINFSFYYDHRCAEDFVILIFINQHAGIEKSPHLYCCY